MKALLCSVAVLGMGLFMSLGIVGCSASADVDPHGTSSSGTGSYEKKTTTVEHPNGSTEVHTETHNNN